jgi:uncharacterized protein DUF6766
LRLRRFVYENGLALFFGAIFLAALIGQAFAGWHSYNVDQAEHASPQLSFLRYVTSSSFAVAVTENWQSEYLQFTLYILLTVWLLQRGSPESKPLGQEGPQSEKDERLREHAQGRSPRWAKVGGLRTLVYSNSLVFAMVAIWVGSWVAQAITGHSEYNADRLEHQVGTVSLLHYIGTASFWERTLQNWQSEFLAVGSMAILSVYLRQRGSPESKAVGAPHDETGS